MDDEDFIPVFFTGVMGGLMFLVAVTLYAIHSRPSFAVFDSTGCAYIIDGASRATRQSFLDKTTCIKKQVDKQQNTK